MEATHRDRQRVRGRGSLRAGWLNALPPLILFAIHERPEKFYFVAFVFIKDFDMDKNLFTVYYAPLRSYVDRCSRKLGNLLRDCLPDVLLIAVSVAAIMCIWEFCFWR